MGSQLRDLMVRDMDARNLAPRTIETYVDNVRGLAKFYMRSPDQLSDDEVDRYLTHIRVERKLSPSTCNQVRSALKFLFEVTLRRPCAALTRPPMKTAKKLPDLLSVAEVARIIEATRTLRERVLLMATYGGGLRVSEVTALRPADLDVGRGVIRVVQGKGRKDRYTTLAESLVLQLDQYHTVYGRPEHWVFPTRSNPTKHIDIASAQKIYTAAKRRAGVTKAGGIHGLRHAFATHNLEAGLDIGTIGRMLGHRDINTTMRYVHTTTGRVAAQTSPLDRLQLRPPSGADTPTAPGPRRA